MCRGPQKIATCFQDGQVPPPQKKKQASNVYLDWLWSKHGKKGFVGHPSHIGNPWLLMGGWSSSPGSMAVVVLWGRCRAVRHSKQPAPNTWFAPDSWKRPTAHRRFPCLVTSRAQHMPNRSRYCFPGDYDHDDQRLGRRKNTHYGEWMTLRSQVWGSKTVLVDRLPMHFHAITIHVISREHVVWSHDWRSAAKSRKNDP